MLFFTWRQRAVSTASYTVRSAMYNFGWGLSSTTFTYLLYGILGGKHNFLTVDSRLVESQPFVKARYHMSICDKWEQTKKLLLGVSHKSVKYDRPGECSPEKDCLRWHWLTIRQPERKSSSVSSELWIVIKCYKSLVVVLIGRWSCDVIGRLSVKLWFYWL